MPASITTTGKANSNSATVSTITIVGATTSGSNRQLLVGVSIKSGSAAVTTITRGSETFTQLGEHRVEPIGELWRVDSEPATTSTDIVINFDNNKRTAVEFVGLQDVDQTTPYGAVSSGAVNGTSLSVSPASTTSDLVVDVLGTEGDATSQAVTETGQVEDVNNPSNSDAATRVDGYMSHRAGQASTTTMGWDWTTTVKGTMLAVAVKPAAVVGAILSIGKNHPKLNPLLRM